MKTYKEFIHIAEGQLTAYGQLRYGSTPATASNRSVSSAVDQALANMGTSQSASETKGKTGITGSGYINYSGSINNRPQPTTQTTRTTRTTTPGKPVLPTKPGMPVPPRVGMPQPPMKPNMGMPPVPPRVGMPPITPKPPMNVVNQMAQNQIDRANTQRVETDKLAKVQADRERNRQQAMSSLAGRIQPPM